SPSYSCSWATRRGQRPWHVQTLLAREPGVFAIDRSAPDRSGAGGANGGGQGEREPARQGPGTEPGNRVTGSGAHTESRKGKEEGAHLAAHPASAQSEGSLLVAADAQPGRRLDSSTANPSSVS